MKKNNPTKLKEVDVIMYKWTQLSDVMFKSNKNKKLSFQEINDILDEIKLKLDY